MIIAFGSDHGGVQLKAALIEFARQEGHIAIDCGTNSSQSIDYPDYAKIVAGKIIAREADRGVLICKTGIGMSIAANKVRGIRAALAYNEEIARLSKRHNDANVLCFGAGYTKADLAERILTAWLESEFEGGRHQRRVNKLQELEEMGCEF
ncbi:MAG TPA: ribose 5-phosphate isomerase B [Candidatus Marinimicrobia bacterium]|nr:ribose 5-phosphate isomerase B [Candidatus Neomarinimicrobiota bacterium]